MKAIPTLLAAAIIASGCATVGSSPEAMRAKSVRELVSMLNLSRRENRVARQELVRRGGDAVPEMTAEMQRLANGRISESDASKLIRLVRVFSEMRSGAAVPTCTDLLTHRSRDIGGSQRTRCALLSESLVYLSGRFNSASARNAYVNFVTQQESEYLQRRAFKQHWGAMGEANYLRVDIVSAIPKLVQADRTKGREVLRHVMRSMTRQGLMTTSVCCLDDNGYDIVLADVSPAMGL